MKPIETISAHHVCRSISLNSVSRGALTAGLGLASARPVMGNTGLPYTRDAGLAALQTRMQERRALLGVPTWLAPFMVFVYAFMRVFGVRRASASDVVAIEQIVQETLAHTEYYHVWNRVLQRMVTDMDAARAEGKAVKAPDWFVWLGIVGLGISPAKLITLMGRYAKSRIELFGWSRPCDSSRANAPHKSLVNMDPAGLCEAHILPD